MKKIRNNSTDMLFEALLKLNTIDECYALFQDLCTIKELQDMAQRLEVAILLDRKLSYQEISKQTGISSATISRVNKCLVYGDGGYKMVIDRVNSRKEQQDD